MSQGVTVANVIASVLRGQMPGHAKQHFLSFQGDKEAMQTLLGKSAKLLATTVDENRRR